ncbi:DUF202 domain-containing protein [Streptococcus caprae]|uniref:DUF202 domain-containing protein n=1 Tax=Streptococcus caprae TaxID=1640501 RepID=A0ABV8CSX4_9STRE
MDRTEFLKGYEQEIAYQKHMLENIGRWFQVAFLLATVSLVLLYYFHSHLWMKLLFGLFLILGVLGMTLLGQVIYRGRKNLLKVQLDLEKKLAQ